MSLIAVTSPHAHGALSTGAVMRNVLWATVPGVAVLTYYFGAGVLVNIAVCCILALAFESLALRLWPPEELEPHVLPEEVVDACVGSKESGVAQGAIDHVHSTLIEETLLEVVQSSG